MEHSGWNTLSMQIKVDIAPGPCPQLYYKRQDYIKRKNWAQWKEVFINMWIRNPTVLPVLFVKWSYVNWVLSLYMQYAKKQKYP